MGFRHLLVCGLLPGLSSGARFDDWRKSNGVTYSTHEVRTPLPQSNERMLGPSLPARGRASPILLVAPAGRYGTERHAMPPVQPCLRSVSRCITMLLARFSGERFPTVDPTPPPPPHHCECPHQLYVSGGQEHVSREQVFKSNLALIAELNADSDDMAE